MDYVSIEYNGKQLSVPKEVADFLSQDRKRQQAQERQDRRHLSKSDFETVLSWHTTCDSTEDLVLRNLRLENLRKEVSALSDEERQLISLRYDQELTMEAMGKILGVSKMAVSKRLKKLHNQLKGSVQ